MRMLCGFMGCICLLNHCGFAPATEPDPPKLLIGYNEHRTNLPGGRHVNVSTNRAMMVRGDGTDRRLLAADLADEAGSWTQFAGWSPDGTTAVVGRGWESVENAVWEEEHKTFRFTPEGWLYDSYLVSLATGTAENVTMVDRVSFYNAGLFFWQNDPQKLGFTALIDGNSKPFRMDRDGRNKIDLTKNSDGFAYGFSSSPDGSRISYHENYQVYLADADGSNRVHVQTGHSFVFAPSWSPDGKWLLFVSGEHYNCHPHVVRADGTGLKKLADRSGYRGVIEFLDVPDYHGGSSDVPVWSIDSQSVFYTAKIGDNVELFQITLDGQTEQLTSSPEATLHYHPKPSPDGDWIVYGSKRNGVRNLLLMRLSDRKEYPLTDLPAGHAAMHAYWQPMEIVHAAEIPDGPSAQALHPGIRLSFWPTLTRAEDFHEPAADLAAFVLTQKAPASVVTSVLAPMPKNGSQAVGDFAFEEKDDRLLILLHGKPAAQFVFRDEKILRPYFDSVHAPNGLQVTRNHPPLEGIDATDHDTLHPGLWLGFGDISGNDYWRNKARIEHLRFTEPPRAKDDRLTFSTESQLLTSDTQPLCRLNCRFTLASRPSGWLLVWDATFHADRRDFAFGDQEEMGFGARVATPMTEKNGGRILSSEGLLTAAKTWGQPAKWCDYAGTVGDREGGITLMAATSNFRGSWWHNRDYGVFVANPFGRSAMKQGEPGTITVQQGQSLRITFGALLHDGINTDGPAEFVEFEKLAKP